MSPIRYLLSACLAPTLLAAEIAPPPAAALHLPAAAHHSPDIPRPGGKRIPFGWPSFAVAPAGDPQTTTLTWSRENLPPGNEIRLRLATALDLREITRVEIRFPTDQTILGTIDFTQAPVFQIGELALTRAQAERALREGLQIVRDTGSAPLRFVGPDPDATGIPPLLQPHLMIAGETDRWEEFYKRLAKRDTIQTFSWMEGCLLDGIHDLDRAFPHRNLGPGLADRLDLYLADDKLVYENPRSEPADDRVYGIEGSLPFAVVARLMPDHPSLGTAVNFWKKERKTSGFAEGSIQDGDTCSAEGSYTVGYPLMVIARQRGDEELVQLAIEQFRVRKNLLVDDNGDIWLRNKQGKHSMKNWARGVAWYYLGLVRGIIEAGERDDIADLREEALRVMNHVLAHQQPDGQWKNLFDETGQSVDTSGSAGIAAALALGAKHGILPDRARQAAAKTLAGLEPFLTPDGMLAHGTPSNRSREGISTRRVIFPVGMGLAAQLIAALQ